MKIIIIQIYQTRELHNEWENKDKNQKINWKMMSRYDLKFTSTILNTNQE